MRKMVRLALAVSGLFLLGLLMIGTTGWGVLAIYYSDLESPALRVAFAGTFGLLALIALIGLASRRWRRRMLIGYTVLFIILVAWWSTIKASNDRAWQPEVAVLPYATLEEISSRFTTSVILTTAARPTLPPLITIKLLICDNSMPWI